MKGALCLGTPTSWTGFVLPARSAQDGRSRSQLFALHRVRVFVRLYTSVCLHVCVRARVCVCVAVFALCLRLTTGQGGACSQNRVRCSHSSPVEPCRNMAAAALWSCSHKHRSTLRLSCAMFHPSQERSRRLDAAPAVWFYDT